VPSPPPRRGDDHGRHRPRDGRRGRGQQRDAEADGPAQPRVHRNVCRGRLRGPGAQGGRRPSPTTVGVRKGAVPGPAYDGVRRALLPLEHPEAPRWLLALSAEPGLGGGRRPRASIVTPVPRLQGMGVRGSLKLLHTCSRSVIGRDCSRQRTEFGAFPRHVPEETCSGRPRAGGASMGAPGSPVGGAFSRPSNILGSSTCSGDRRPHEGCFEVSWCPEGSLFPCTNSDLNSTSTRVPVARDARAEGATGSLLRYQRREVASRRRGAPRRSWTSPCAAHSRAAARAGR